MDIQFLASNVVEDKIDEGLITRSIKKYVEKTNFPKKLLLRKIELGIDKRKEYITTKGKTLLSLKEENKKMLIQLDEIKRRNREKLVELQTIIN